jgi:hypothetical protein
MSNDTVNHNQGNFSDKLKIDILMKEYETLRTDMLQRVNQRFVCIGLIGAVATYAFFKVEKYTVSRVLIIAVAISILGAVWFHFGRLMHQLSLRIAGIEQRINCLVGDELLLWETRGQNKFFYHRLHRWTVVLKHI